MGPNDIVVTVLALVAIILGVIDLARSHWQSTTHWAIIAVSAAVIFLVLSPL